MMFEDLQSYRYLRGRLSPNRPLSSYTIYEKKAIVDQYDILMAEGRDEKSVLVELDVSRDVITRWRLEIAIDQADDEATKQSVHKRPLSSYNRFERKAITATNDRSTSSETLDSNAQDTTDSIGQSSPISGRKNGSRKNSHRVVKRYTIEEKEAEEILARYRSIVQSGDKSREANHFINTNYSIIRDLLRQEKSPYFRLNKMEQRKKENIQKHDGLKSKLTEYISLRRAGIKSSDAASKVGLSENYIPRLLKSGLFHDLEWFPIENTPDLESDDLVDADEKLPEEKLSDEKQQSEPETKPQVEKTESKGTSTTKVKTPSEREEIIAKYVPLVESGKSLTEAARLLDIHYGTIKRWLNDENHPLLKKRKEEKLQRHRELESKLIEFLSLRSAGTNTHEAASKVGLSFTFVYKLLNSGRFPNLEWSPLRQVYSVEERKSILDRYNKLIEEGYYAKEAQKKVGVTWSLLYVWQKKYGSKSNTKRICEAGQSAPTDSQESNISIKKAPRRNRSQRYDVDQRITIVNRFNALVKEGIRREVAWKKSCGELGVPYSTLARWCKKYASGKKPASVNASREIREYSARQKKQILKKYLSLRESGLTAKDAAKKIGVSYFTVNQWKKRANTTPTPSRPAVAKVRKSNISKPKTNSSNGTKSKAKLSSPSSKAVGKEPAVNTNGNLSIVLTNGNRIEGLTFEQIVELVKIT